MGLLLLTNDGALAHNLLAPGKHVEKCYFVRTDAPLCEEAVKKLESGIHIGEKRPALPARVKQDAEDKRACYITITEGKYHQVKRMFQAAGLTVTYLKRVSIGNLKLDKALKEGEMRELTPGEIESLRPDRNKEKQERYKQ